MSIPIKHQCQAVKSLEVLTEETEHLRSRIRTMEERHNEDIRKLWIRLAAVTVAVGFLTGSDRFLRYMVGVIF